jgi:hypothetical protein
LCVIAYRTLPKKIRTHCVNVKGIGTKLRAEVAIIPVLWAGLMKIREPELLRCHRFPKHATDIYKNVSEVMYGFRILNYASHAENASLMC